MINTYIFLNKLGHPIAEIISDEFPDVPKDAVHLVMLGGGIQGGARIYVERSWRAVEVLFIFMNGFEYAYDSSCDLPMDGDAVTAFLTEVLGYRDENVTSTSWSRCLDFSGRVVLWRHTWKTDVNPSSNYVTLQPEKRYNLMLEAATYEAPKPLELDEVFDSWCRKVPYSTEHREPEGFSPWSGLQVMITDSYSDSLVTRFNKAPFVTIPKSEYKLLIGWLERLRKLKFDSKIVSLNLFGYKDGLNDRDKLDIREFTEEVTAKRYRKLIVSKGRPEQHLLEIAFNPTSRRDLSLQAQLGAPIAARIEYLTDDTEYVSMFLEAALERIEGVILGETLEHKETLTKLGFINVGKLLSNEQDGDRYIKGLPDVEDLRVSPATTSELVDISDAIVKLTLTSPAEIDPGALNDALAKLPIADQIKARRIYEDWAYPKEK